METKNIKNYDSFLWEFILINICIFVVLSSGNIDFDSINQTYNKIVKSSVIAAISGLITFILNGVLTPNFKASIVFWRIKNPLPGSRVFTKLILNDSRINKDILIKKYGELPIDPQGQNRLWYQFFKSNEFNPMIFDSHRKFLISRDMTGLAFLFLFIFTISAFIAKMVPYLVLYYIGFLFAQYIIIAIVSKHYGNRFACNVVALASVDEIQFSINGKKGEELWL